ncbi:nitroreductase family protein [uncultured Limosilactobacillus sp.]|uniref:nitroreductase family protein n=1 Tax=uncultured Limosilactobacillus sp. TaxID=2837629 RepID=UPI002598A9DF|nr:nitroreductase family protein [uncultured Limosilactobacillus sp.]
MLHNFTIDHQLNHRTIRKFKDQPLTEEQLTTLFEVARQTSSSEFLQQMTIIRVTDPQKRAAIRAVSTQPYVGAEGELLMFITDPHRNELIRHHQGNLDDRRIEKTEMFLQAYEDTVLAVQNVLNANEYQDIDPASLKDYDQIVNTYYDLRDANRRIDTFTDQVNGPKLNGTPQVRDQIAQVLHDQKLCLDL